MIRVAAVSIALISLVAIATPGAASQRFAFKERLDRLKAKNPAGVKAAWTFFYCNEAAAKTLAEREMRPPSKLWPIGAEAMEAIAQCKAEEQGLAVAVPTRELQKLKTIVHAINAETIERIRRARTQPIICAQAEWRGCSMKPIQDWKSP
jgi:hypothetical protein